MNTIIISGANGFIGSELTSHFNRKGFIVRALIHNPAKIPVIGVGYYTYNFGDAVEEKIFEQADCFIHCAYDKHSLKLNIEGTRQLLALSKKYGVKKNIFISSLSSREDALSIYGKQKWACEKLFNQPNDIVLRLGMVIGNGGLFGQMKNYLQQKNRIPIISGGQQPIQTIYIRDLMEAIDRCIEKNFTGTISIASSEKLAYKEFYSLICKSLHVVPSFTSIPYGLLYFCLSVSETLGIKLPVSRENILGLKKQSYVDTTADLKKIGIELKTCADSLSELSLKA
jgi:nucleoside-diphosphate-sugar epimerase